MMSAGLILTLVGCAVVIGILVAKSQKTKKAKS